MNKTYKVIYNWTRCMYQVVSELAKGHTKSETPEILKSLFSKHSGLTRGIVMAVLSMSLAMPVGVAVQAEDVTAADTNLSNLTDKGKGVITTEATTVVNTAIDNKVGSLDANGNYIQKAASVSSNLSTLDTQVKTNADAVSKEKTDREAAVSGVNNTINSLSDSVVKYDTDSNKTKVTLTGEGGTTITNVKDGALSDSSTDAVTGKQLYAEQTARANADTDLGNRITSNATDITNLEDLSNITTAGETVIKKQVKQAVKVAATGNATVSTSGSEDDDSTLIYTINVSNNGAIASGDTNLVSGGTMYTELRPDSTGTYYYISNTNTTAANLIALDTNLKNVIDAIGLDADDTTTSYTSKLNKYFKVNPEVNTSTDGKTKTYARADAAANGTNSVAIGPSAQAGEKTTDATTSTTTVTGGTSSTAIGDSAAANGNTSVALGANAQVLNTTDQDGKTTATVTGSTAIGSGAKVNGAADAAAIGTSAQVNETATGGIAFGKNAVTGEDKGTVTVSDVTANVAAVGGENSVALGTDAKASGNTALALGNGAQVNNYTTQSGTTVTKTVNSGSTAIGSEAKVTGANDAVAFGSGASVTGTGTNADDSMAIGKSASVATAKDAVALGTSAAVASGADNAIAVGNTAKANTSNTTAIGYNASATGAGAIAIGENTSTSTEGGISIGSGTSVSGRSIAIGYSNDGVTTGSDNTDAVAIGNGAQANANDSVSIGHQAGKGTTEGRNSGYGSLIAIGTNAGNNVKGMQNVAMGSGAGSNVKSSYNVAIGSNAGSGINYAAATDDNPQNGYNVSIGYEANYQSADANAKNIAESIAIGHSANAVSNATALGYNATASGDKSMALGYSAKAADTDSIALGDNTSAGGGNIAIGSGSQAPAVTTYASSYLTNNTTVNGYISLGGTTSATTGTTVLRRISNVADGSADQDAVTVAQLKQAYTNLEGTIKTTDNKITDTYTQSAIDSKIATVESKITASQTKYFSINPSSDTLTANVNNDGASTTGAADAMAIGPNASATSSKAVAIGNNVSASGKGSLALGTADNPATTGTVDAGNNTSANPHVTSAEGANSVAIGTSAIAQTDNSVALGTRASVYTSNVTDTTTGTTTKVGQQSIAIGYEAETRNSEATSIGSGAKAYSNGSTAIGHSAYAQGADSAVIGTSSTANGASSGILGKSNTVNGSNTYAVGSENNVNGNWGAVTYSGLYGSKNIVNPVSDTSGNTKHGMDSLSITGNSNTISQGSYSDTVQNISILGNGNSVTGANTDEANAGTTANITVIGGNNEVTGRDGAGSDYMGKTWNQLTRTSIIGYGNKVNQATSTTSLADTQILGNDVTATLGNSVYLGTGSSAKNANSPDTDTLTKAETDAANAVDTTGMTDDQKTTALSDAKAKARYAVKLAAMKANNGSTAGTEALNTDTTYDDGTSYSYAGSSPVGVVTVGSAGKERRIQNVAAGLVSASSTDAVNGSQLYALTRQIRFGGDNSSFGKTTAAEDQNVVARGSNETISITGGSDAVTSSTADGTTTYTVDAAKLTGNNIAVVANTDTNALHVQLASNLKDLNTASMGKTTTGTAADGSTTTSYQETLKLDGTGDNGGTLALEDASGKNGVTLRTSGSTTTADVNGTATTRLLVNDKTVATTDDGLKFGGDTGNDSALKLNNKLNVKGGTTDTSKLTDNNIGVVSDGSGTLTVKLNKNVNLGTDGSLTTGAVTATAVTADTVTSGHSTLNTNGLIITNGPSVLATGINADSKKITNVSDGEANADAANFGQVKAAKTTLSQGNNVTITPDTASEDGHTNYTVSVSNLSYKAGTDTTAKNVTLATGLTFNNGKNTTAVAGDNGTITYNLNDKIELGAETDSNNHIVVDGTQGLLTLGMDATINGNAGTASIGGVSIGKLGSDQVITGLTNKTWTVGTTQAVDGRAATENQLQSVADNLNTANTNIATLQHGFKIQANGDTTTESTVKADDALNFTAGDNAKVTTTKASKQITISVDNLSVKANNGTAQSVKLADGLNFQDGTNTNVTVGTNGSVTYDLKSSITLGTSTDEANRIIVNGTNGTITVGNLATINGNAGTASIGGVSIGKSGNDQTVTGLSNRIWVVGESTAVNGRAATEDQLQSVSNAAHTNANNITTLQQGFTVTANGKTDTKSTVKAGETLNFQAGKNVQVSTTADSKSIEVALSDTPEFTTVTAKDASGNATTVSGTGVTIAPTGTGAQSVSLTSEGLDNGSHVIRNVVSGGTVRTNAANIGDLQDAISNALTTTTNTGFKVKGDDTTSQTVKLGKQLNVVGGTTDSTQLSTGNIGVETTADAEGNATLTVKLKKDIALDSVTTGSTTMNTTGVSNGNMSLTNTGMIIKNNDVSKQVSITTSGVSMGSQQVKNVADGTDTKDAVNKGQLDVIQTQVTNGWQIVGSNGQKVADIGAGKKVTFGDTTYATASVQPEGTEGAKVTYTIKTAGLTADTATGKITEPTTDGVATAQNVAQAINSAAWNIKANDDTATAIKAGTTVGLKAGNNLTLSQSDTDFTYTLNDTLTGIKSLATVAQDGVTTTLTAGGVTIASSGTGDKSVSLTANGLNNGGKQITDVASGGDTDTNAANISDVKRLVQASANGTTETGFNVKGDDVTAKKVKLGKQLNVVGGTNDASKLSDNNIGVVTTADAEGNATLTVKLNKDINLDSVKTGNTTLNTNGVSNGDMSLTNTGLVIKNNDASKQVSVTTSGVSMGSQRIQNVADAANDTDAATLEQVKKARTKVAAGDNVKEVAPSESTDGSHQMTYTVNVDNLSVKANNEAAKSVTLKNGLTFNNGTNTTASVGDNGEVKYDLNSTLTGLTSVTAGNSTLDTNGLTISGGPKFTKKGIDAGSQKITGVADGENANDAINKGQLDALQNQVSGGWNLAGKNSDGTAVTAKIGAGKTVTYTDGAYTKSVVTKDDSDNAMVKVDVTTGTLTVGVDGKITSTDGLATTGAVEKAVNSASWKIQDGDKPQSVQQVKAGDTVSLKAGDNLSLDQNGREFTYKLNKTLENMTSVTVVDDKQNTSVLNGEGLKVSDKDGNSLTQHATEIRIHDSNAKADDATTDVVLKKDGLHNGGHTITGVADGQLSVDSKEAVNGSQLYALQQKVTNGGWDIIGENENRSTHIGNDKTVSFKNGRNSTVSVTGTDTGAEVKVDVNTAQISTDGSTHTATVTGTGLADATEVVNAINSAAWNVQKQGGTVQQVKAGDAVTFDASNNIVLTQNGTSFTYGLAPDVNTKSIRLGGSQDTSGNWTGGIFIGNQIGGGANHNEGNYITGLDNTSWDLSKVVDNRAATEAQLKAAINQITLKEQNGGFALKDESGTEKGKVSQTLGNAIAIVGDTEYESDGKTVKKAGNITTEADGTNVGGIKVKLNKNLDLSDDGSLRVGSSKVSNGAIQLGEDASANKILMDSKNGAASIGGVTVNGAEKTVNGLSNTKWTGKAVDGQAATENQLVEAINEAKTQAANSELHIKKGVYAIGKDSNGQDITDKTSKNSVSIDVVNAQGTVDGQVVINDVAKASELGTVGELADNLKNPAGGSTTVVQAVNKVNQKVDDSLKQVNGDISNAVTEARKHTEVKSVDSDNNVTIDGTTTNADGGTIYKLGLNKNHLNLGNVHVYGNEGRITAKTVEAETVKIDDQTRLDTTGLTTGNTTVANNRIVVGGDNGIKIEANGGQQMISGLTNTDWTGTAVHGRAATEDQLAKAISSATTTAAQNEQHIKAGTYDIQTTTDDKGNKQNSVTMKIVDGTGKDKGTVTINDVAKASDIGDTDKLAADIKNQNGGQPQTTSVVEAVNNLNEKVNNRVGDNKYSAITSKDPVQDGDSSTTAIGKLNNRMKDIYDKATQHASVSVDENLTMDDTKQNASGGTDYKIGLNKENIDLGHVTIKGNAGSISAKSMTADSFTAGDTVVNNEGVKVGDKSALTGDSLKVGDKTYVDNNGLNANGNAIHNVGEGKEDTDAVNVKQVNDLAARQGEAITENATHIGELGRAVNKLGNRLNRVGAGAAALAALHPGTYDPNDKWDFSAGIGHYHDANAVAIGAYYHPNDTTILSIGGSMGGGENMVNAGITWKMGRSGREQAAQPVVVRKAEAAPVVQQAAPVRPAPVVTPAPVTTPAPVKSVASVTPVQALPAVTTPMTQTTTGDTSALAQILARQTAILEKLAQNQAQAAPSAAVAHGDDIFPDVPDNHWAYAYVAKLEKAGALKGFKRPAVLKSPMMTRDDFASVLYTAMANGATTNPALNGDDSLNRLAQEFKAELKNVKV